VRWLVDGMNVIGTRPDGWWSDRDGAMRRLVGLLEQWASGTGDEVIVVFERPPSPPIRSTVIEVTHAPRARANAADDEIVRRLKADPGIGATRVVTSDRWLGEQASSMGAAVVSAESFRREID
jgi:predicted RNA-binding protein with PIN domain